MGGLNPTVADNLLIMEANGGVTTLFYYKPVSGNPAWYTAAYQPAGNRLINAGSAFFIWRKAANPFNWVIPAEVLPSGSPNVSGGTLLPEGQAKANQAPTAW